VSDIDWLDILDGAIERVDGQLDKRDPRIEEIKRSRELTARVFNTEDGQKLLTEWLKEMSVSSGITGESTQIEAGINEGRRQRVREILIAIKQVREAASE
tara:strand:- start:4971 stop:5270 length:300 start_codon:yes stop_codon:yes gene_type:complete